METRLGPIPVRWSPHRQRSFETGSGSGRRRILIRPWPNSNCPYRNGPESQPGASRLGSAVVPLRLCRRFGQPPPEATSGLRSGHSGPRWPRRSHSPIQRPPLRRAKKRPRRRWLRRSRHSRPSFRRCSRNPNLKRQPAYQTSGTPTWTNPNLLRSPQWAPRSSGPISICCPVGRG